MSEIAGWFSDKNVLTMEFEKSWQNAVEKLPSMHGAHGWAVCSRPNGMFLQAKGEEIPSQKPPFMEFSDGKETYSIIYDGHLTNGRELRCRLVKAGLNFLGHDDSEVVLKAYLYWGELCVHYLKGSFSFAILEESAGKVFAARDPVGMKPFYYTQTPGGLLFSSRIKLLFASGCIQPLIEEDGFYSLIFLSPAHIQGTTAFKNIFELPMGHTLSYQNKRLKIKEYWSPKLQPHEETLSETISHTRYYMKEALRQQLGSEENLCVLFPSSLGSEIISQAIADLSFLKGRSYLSFPDCLRGENGTPLSNDLTAELILPWPEQQGNPGEAPVVSPEAYIAALRDFAGYADLPGMGGQDALQYLLYQNVKPNSQIAFTPLGVDEFFGGHPWYCNRDMLFDSIFPWCRSVPIRSGIIQQEHLRQSRDYIFGAYESMIAKIEARPGEKALEQRMREIFILNLNWYLPAFLRQAEVLDRLTGVETRIPFCDRKLIEYAYNIPWGMKALDGLEKGILRKAAEEILPHERAWRPETCKQEDGNGAFYEILEAEVKIILGERDNELNAFLNQKQILYLLEQSKNSNVLYSASKSQICRLFAWLVQVDEWLKTNGVIFEL